ncbi:hypothetical protein BGZ97_012406 [Linnemannia gamsii]|uniref:C2 domain-containing protein n=1 Tax=Linnemannia gamsii TaxID=64522 RepID=A0A9P6UKN2_9FUNG|nr:hypothetical protein BGZ97_012406 [Linnemannia gamsii]
MKFITIAAMLLVPVTLATAAPTLAEEYNINLPGGAANCIDHASSTPNTENPSIAASLRRAPKIYLTDKDLFGKSDPFIEMWLEKAYKQRSKDSKGLNPVFNQTFCFYVRPGQDKLYVRAIDKDTLINDKIGDTSISLSNVFMNGKVGPKNCNLQKWLGLSTNGQINMEMQFVEDYGQN